MNKKIPVNYFKVNRVFKLFFDLILI
jgi:hypothetical protein